MKKLVVLLLVVVGMAFLAEPTARAGVRFAFGLPIPFPVFYGPGYYGAGPYYYGAPYYGYGYYPGGGYYYRHYGPYWRNRSYYGHRYYGGRYNRNWRH